MSSDLWPKDLFRDVDLLVPPREILERQAHALTERSAGLVRGEIASSVRDDEERWTFWLVGQDGYRHELLWVTNPRSGLPYPCVVHDPLDSYAHEPQELVDRLSKIFADATTRGIVTGMAVRARQAQLASK